MRTNDTRVNGSRRKTPSKLKRGARTKTGWKIASVMMSIVLALGMTPLPAFAYEGANTVKAGQAQEQLIAQNELTQGVQAQDGYELEYSYNPTLKTATVEGLTAESTASGSLVIPSTVVKDDTTYTVTSIASNAFKGMAGFTGTLTLPDTLITINASAFEGCTGLTGNLNLPASLKHVNDAAFKDCAELAGPLNLPASLETLGSYAFSGCFGMAGTVTIPAGVTAIGDHCFYMPGNSRYGERYGITGIAFAPGSKLETIGAYAFAENWKVTGGISLPDSVKTIEDYAFYATYRRRGSTSGNDEAFGAQGTLHLNNGLQTIGQNAFGVCSFSGNLVIPDSVTSIGDDAFYEAGFVGGTLTLPDSLTAIGKGSFQGDLFVGALTLPSGLTSIGESVFSGCTNFNSQLTIPAGVTEIGRFAFSGFGSNGTPGALVLPNGLKTIDDYAFSGASHFMGALNIPDSVEAIGRSAFSEASGFSALKLPANENFTVVADEAFGSRWSSSWMGFTGTLDIPDSVTSIGENAFSRCSSLTGELKLPDGVTSIGDNAFDRCSGFTGTLTLPSSLATIGEQAFTWCSGLTGLVIPNGVTSIGGEAFFGCEAMRGDLVIPGSVKTIGQKAFGQFGMRAESMGTLTIQDGVETIEYATFGNCSMLTGTAAVPDSVTTLGSAVFSGCDNLTGYRLPDSLTSVPNSLFSGCRKLTGQLVIPSHATSIESYAFSNCESLTGDLAIPDGVTRIGSYAFKGCAGFNGTLSIPNSVTSIDSSAFQGCAGLIGNLQIPENVKSIGYEAFEGCTGFNGTLSIPEGVTSIGSSAFQGCAGLHGALTIPEGVTSVGSYAFQGCAGLTGDVTIPSTLSSLSNNIFYGCENLTGTLTIPASVTKADETRALQSTYFSTIVNNSALTFDGPSIFAAGVAGYYADSAGVKATALGTGTFTRQTFANVVDISGAQVSDIPDYKYNGGYHYPEPTVTLNGTVLQKDVDYTLSYSSNRYVGMATVIVKGYGYNGYTGSVEKKFRILDTNGNFPGDQDEPGASTISLEAQSAPYTGSALAYSGKVTKTGSTGAVTYAYYSDAACTKAVAAANVKNAGVYYVKATLAADDNYAAATSDPATFTITPKAATPKITLSKNSFVYNGKVQKPKVTVKVGNTTLPSTAYKLSWAKGCKNVGAYKVKVTLTGNYSGTKTASFTIVPKSTTIASLKPVSKGFTVKWKKQATQTTGYQIQYALNAKFTKSAKTVTVKGAKTVSKKVTKLKAKKKYFVHVRTYKTVSKTNYYSAWSKASAVTTKK